ncbi:hypothetical protein [Oleiharenicola lentus]|uniref:hypothetical protein n=1 Tax=Oleiharenicola lentus TaxID=2508720 RepID=UPI003F676F10
MASFTSVTSKKRAATRRRTLKPAALSVARKRTPQKRWFIQHWRALAAVVLVALGVSIFWGRVDFETIHANIKSIPGGWAFLAMVILPLVGCPATVVNIGAGLRFGIAGGLPLVVLAIVLHQFLAFGLVRLMPGVFTKLVAPIRKRLPQASHTSLTIFSALLPGVPYWMQVYALPLIGVPLRTILLCSVPFHTVRSLLALVGAGVSDHLNAWWIAGLVVYAAVLLTACAWAGRRVQQQVAEASRRRRTTSKATREVALSGAGK